MSQRLEIASIITELKREGAHPSKFRNEAAHMEDVLRRVEQRTGKKLVLQDA